MRSQRCRALVLCGLAVLPLLAACSDERAEAAARAAGERMVDSSARAVDADLSRANFDVTGMDCGGCVIGVRTALERLNGVTEAEVSYEHERAVVTYEPAKVSTDRMLEAIREFGYTATLRSVEDRS